MTFKEDGVQVFPFFAVGAELHLLQTLTADLFRKAEIRETAESTLSREVLDTEGYFAFWLKKAFSKEWTATHLGGPLERTDYHAHRLYPWPHNHFGAYQWHYDAHPHWPMKAMLLLTDLDEQGQAMEYVKEKPFRRSFLSYEETRWHDTEIAEPPGERVPIIGAAGTLWLFHAWNWHRGARKMAPIRDTITIEWIKRET